MLLQQGALSEREIQPKPRNVHRVVVRKLTEEAHLENKNVNETMIMITIYNRKANW
jgi:hypothetical protein